MIGCKDARDCVSIEYLADHPEALPTLRSWFETEWPGYYGAHGPGNAETDLRAYSSRDRLPIGLIAFYRAELCGICALKAESIATHRHLSPWATALLVAPQYRRRGIGRCLVSALEDVAARLGYSVIYCGTSTAHGLLRANQWQLAESTQAEEERILIYRKRL